MRTVDQLGKILEGILFASEKPMSIEMLLQLFEEDVEKPTREQIKESIAALQTDYENRGIALQELASGFQFAVRPESSQWVRRLYAEKTPRYSRAFLETLALIAYRQPITRGEIEEIRGVTVGSNIVKTFIEREWVKEIGHKDLPGRPALLGTTKAFLDYFGLKRLSDLPPLAEIQDLDKAGAALEKQLSLDPKALEGEPEDEGEEDVADSEKKTESRLAPPIALEESFEEVVDALDRLETVMDLESKTAEEESSSLTIEELNHDEIGESAEATR